MGPNFIHPHPPHPPEKILLGVGGVYIKEGGGGILKIPAAGGFKIYTPLWAMFRKPQPLQLPCPSFPCFFGKWPGKRPKKQGFFIPSEPLKSLEKKGKTLKKTRNSSQGEKNRNSKKTRKDRVVWKVRQYTSNLYGSTPPICIAVLCWLLSFEERETPQYASHLYRNTPPICTAVRPPFVRQYFWKNTGGWGHRNVSDPPLPPKVPFWPKWGRGGGAYIIFPWVRPWKRLELCFSLTFFVCVLLCRLLM